MAHSDLTRGDRRLYPLSGSDRYSYFPGLVRDGRQVLMGLYCPSLVAIFFDPEGRLLGADYRRLPYLDLETLLVYDYRFLDDLRVWQEELAFRQATIYVEKFSFFDSDSDPNAIAPDEPVRIEIRDEPEYLREVLSDQGEAREQDRKAARQELAEWKREGRFVLFWRTSEHQVDRSGRY